jgi:DNA-binding transcriptional MerR regulator
MAKQESMQIGELAKKSGVSVRSIRYYEELGLLKPSGHSEGGFRLYHDEDLNRLDVIKYLKLLGLSLNEVKQIFDSAKSGSDREDAAIAPLIALLTDRLAMTSSKITQLEAIRKEICNTLEILTVCRTRDAGLPMFHEQRQVCENCDNLKARHEIPKMLSIFF